MPTQSPDDELVRRARALSRCEHSDLSIGDELADRIEALTRELADKKDALARVSAVCHKRGEERQTAEDALREARKKLTEIHDRAMAACSEWHASTKNAQARQAYALALHDITAIAATPITPGQGDEK